MSISKQVLADTVEMFKGHLFDYEQDIDVAYLEADDALTVSLKAKYSPSGSQVKIDTSIEFIKEKIKNKNSMTSGNGYKQMSLDDVQLKYRDILFRNFDDIRAVLAKLRWMQDDWKRQGIKFKKF